jgi:XTP/dITP diphosphohydrolase
VKLLLATNNEGKIRELQALLADLGVDATTPRQEGLAVEVEETEPTFEGNARLKAQAFAKASGLLSLADDSGLEVDALGGEPGVRTARYAGDNATDEQRVAYLLKKMEGVPWEKRTARFRCVVAIAGPTGPVHYAEGEVRGYIATEPHNGPYGFGYDPIFYVPESGKCLAEIPLAEKNRISHRGRAALAAHAVLERLLQ